MTQKKFEGFESMQYAKATSQRSKCQRQFSLLSWSSIRENVASRISVDAKILKAQLMSLYENLKTKSCDLTKFIFYQSLSTPIACL